MSRIDDLIRELCPSGVEHRALGVIGQFERGNGIQKADFVESGVGCIHYGQIHTHYGTWATETKSFVSPELAARTRRAKQGDLVVATTSEDDEAVGKAVAWLGSDEVAVSTDAFIYRHSLDPKYVAHFFQTEQFHAQKRRHVTGTKVRRISGGALAKIRIPVPPLEVQREIVRVLDLFQSLEAELEARRRQYAHYQARIIHDGMPEHRWVRLHEVADIMVGFPFKSAQFSDDPTASALIRGDNVGQGTLKDRSFKRWHRAPDDGLAEYELSPGDIVVAMDRPWIPAGLKWARIGAMDLPALLVQRVARLRGRSDDLEQSFLGCLVASPAFTEHILRVQTGNTVPHISAAQIGAFRFRLPSLDEQERIARTLGRFDALLNDLSVGLPAELAARRRQYEYYRDRLLSFEEAA